MLKVATWNVNSLRVRLPQVLTWLQDVKPDVLALQETKLPDVDFPQDVIRETGYIPLFSGQKTYNGMALFCRQEANEIVTELPGMEDAQRRMLGVTIGDVRIVNLYVPNGESPTSEKYQYKLNWLHQLRIFLTQQLEKYQKMIVLGDFNIAPAPIDVYDPAQQEGQILFSELERQAFDKILQIGFSDCFRYCAPDERAYSWWDYRLNAFKRNMGFRIDHILASPALVSQCTTCYVDIAPRGWVRPSDHAPVIAAFSI